MADLIFLDEHWTKWLRVTVNDQGASSESEVYLDAHGRADATSLGGSAVRFCTQSKLGTKIYTVDRKPLYFDTSTLGSITISAARIVQQISFISDRVKNIRVVDAPDLNDPPVVADYGYVRGLSTSLGELDTGDMTTSAINVWTLNATGRAAIVTDGTTKFAFRTVPDITSTIPTQSLEGIQLLSIGMQPYAELSTLEIDFSKIAGFIWTEGKYIHWTDQNGIEQRLEGIDTGTNAVAGHLFVEGTYLHYVSEDGDERRKEGTKEGATGKTSGFPWIEDGELRYIDADGDERFLPPAGILGGHFYDEAAYDT